MNRRAFMKILGGAGICGLVNRHLSFAQDPGGLGGKEGDQRMIIDHSRLQNRNQNRSTFACQNGIVCTSQPLASMAGVDILKAGGNAIDAAICSNALLSVVEPMMCGPGGDLFAIVWIEKDRRLYGLNASGRSPYDWSLSQALGLGLREIPVFGPLSWSVPGCLSGWEALHERFGSLKWDTLFESAIHYAREGFPVSPVIAESWKNSVDHTKYPTLAETFAPTGGPPDFGDIFKNPDLASFFETIAGDGAATFYEGEIAEAIIQFSEANGGRFSTKDFRDHEASWVDPVSSNYRGYDVWELPPNGQGIAALQILNILECFDIASMDPNSTQQLHLFIEAKKLAFEDRAVYYADMDFADVPVNELISEGYARERAALINPRRASERVVPGKPTGPSDTVYLTAADRQGNMISFIQSIYYSFGSQMVPQGLGFALQNRGHLFSLNHRDANKLEPYKRPFHTIIPAFVTRRGHPVFSFGVMGGDFQPQGHAQVLMNIIDFGMSPQQAGEQPRVAHYESSTPTGYRTKGGGGIGFERHIPQSVKKSLSDMGHVLRSEIGAYGGYQGIWRRDDPLRYFGGSDSRKDGCAIGY